LPKRRNDPGFVFPVCPLTSPPSLDLKTESVLCDEYADLVYLVLPYSRSDIEKEDRQCYHSVNSLDTQFREGLGPHSCESAMALDRVPQTHRRLVLWCVRCVQRGANASLHALDHARITEPRMFLGAARPRGMFVVLRREVAGVIN